MRYQCLSSLAALLVRGIFAQSDCKCLPTEPCWPSTAKWDSLNTTLAGNLIHSVPPGSVCYPSWPNYNEAACDDVVAAWSTSAFHSSNPVSIDSTVWTNNSCTPIYANGTSVTGDPDAGEKGCSIGAYPPYVVNVTEPSHAQAALKFAKKWNLRLSIKNTGHNGSGRNIGFGSLSIWTHNLKDIQYHDKFTPTGSSNDTTTGQEPHMAFTLGAGVQDGELYEAMGKYNVISVGGTNRDVGVLGWSMGGGHGFMTGTYGNGADNIIEAVIATPNGDVITANSVQNQDIFWAIRGGGGATFGVILSVTLKAYPMPSVIASSVNIAAHNGTSAKAWYQMIAQLHTILPDVHDQGLYGYYTINGPPDSSSLSYVGSFFAYNSTNQTVDNALAPVRKLLDSFNSTATYSIRNLPFPTFYELAQSFPVIEHAGTVHGTTASRLVSRKVVRESPNLVAEAFEKVGPRATAPTDGLPNYAISGTMTISRQPVDSALNPVWRDTAVHLISTRTYDDSYSREQIDTMVNDMTYDKLNVLHQLDPQSGAYLNEANIVEPGWQWSFYGSSYPRLLSIKTKYDPDGLLWCPQCVGSDGWVQVQSGAVCRQYSPL